MNDKRDFDHAVDRWLEDGSDVTPPGVIDAVVLARSTPQERDFRISWRTSPTWRRAYAVAALAVAVAALAVLGPRFGIRSGPTTPAVDLGIFEPVAGRIVYYADSSLWVVDPSAPADAPTRVHLTTNAGTPLGWSSDGTELLIQRDRLFVLHADGSETQVTTDPLHIRGATISPDGSRVVFAGGTGEFPGEPGSCCSEGFALYAVDADGGPVEVLVQSRNGFIEVPSFAPDGTQIAYVDGAGDHSHAVWLIDADGSDAHQILANETTGGASHPYGLAWSPAGDRIALALEGTIYTFATDGSDFTRIAGGGTSCESAESCAVNLPRSAVSPYWSPDGAQIAYTTGCVDGAGAANRAGCNVAISDADGSNVLTFGFGASGPWHPGPVVIDPPEIEPMSELGVFEPVAGRIVYGDDRGIWGVDPAAPADPATRVHLTSKAGDPLGWSSDGTRLLIRREEHLFVLHADGSETQVTERPIVLPFAFRGAAISPDGSRVVFATISGAGNTGFIFAVDADGGTPEVLLERDGLEGVSFSPDGTRIAFVSGHGDGGHRVSVMDADGSNVREILANDVTLAGGHDHGIAWSPAGDRIALGIEGTIYTFTPDGSGFTAAFRLGGQNQPFWSPDGSQLETKGPWHPGTLKNGAGG